MNRFKGMKCFVTLASLGFIFFVLPQSPIQAEEILSLPEGHRIRVDKNIGDWVGLPLLEENTACIDKGEYIWKDAKGDDTGGGGYTYPTSRKLKKGADIREFRVTFDKKRLYLLIKCDRPNDWWVPYRIIGIDQDGATGGKGGGVVLAQGDIDELDSLNGCYGELKVAKELACEYVIGISSTWKGRVWDKDGKLVASVEGDEGTPGFKLADANWYAMEVAVPFDIIGDPRGKTWRFIVGVGLQDGDYFREVYPEADEWHSGGSKEPTEQDDGVDPDVFDLIGANREKQEADLNSYNETGEPSDTHSFCTIKNSFVTVHFGN